MAAGLLELQRVEIGCKVAAHAVGADHHDGADRILHLLVEVGGDDGGADLRGLLRVLHRGDTPVAVHRGDEVAVLVFQRLLPAGAVGGVRGVGGGVSHAAEEALPAFGDGGGVLGVLGVELFDVGGVGAVEKRRVQHGFVVHAADFACLRLDVHFFRPVAPESGPLSRARLVAPKCCFFRPDSTRKGAVFCT